MFVVKIVLCLFWSVVFASKSSLPVKKWFCVDSARCFYDFVDDNVTSFQSQNICRLSCGRYGALWPSPTMDTVISHERAYFDIRNVRFNLVVQSNTSAQYLTEMNKIFLKNILKECAGSCALQNGSGVLVKINVASTSLKLNWDTDESYNLTVRVAGSNVLVDIKSKTVYGARHALETLSQLITGNEGGLVIASSVIIRDKPIYKHRGLLLDTARNFIPLRNIKTTLDGMAASKLNVFHWHATDSQSFPLEISRVPELQRFGAYSVKHTYSKQDIRSIIKYAKIRGIRVLIELDGPSHAGNGWQWGPEMGLGDLAVCVNQQPWRKYCIQPPCGQLNPVNGNTYAILKLVFEDIAELISKEETIHMGGDEVFINCWNSTEEIVQTLRQKGLDRSAASFMKLWAEFHEQNLKSWGDVKANVSKSGQYANLPVIVWSSHLTEPEVIEQYLPKDRYIIQTWVESSLPLNNELIRKGYRIISSTKDAWYLDHGFWGRTQYYNWRKVYDNKLSRDPAVLGGEVCMWSEYVDENSLDPRIWPRAGAAAERLWADPQTNSALAEARFYRYRDRLITRGIKPDAVTPKWCTLHEGECY